MKRKLKIKPIYEGRCNGRLQTKRFTRLAHTGLVVELEHPKIKTRLIIFWRGRTFGFVEIRRGGRGQLNLLHIEIRFAGKLDSRFWNKTVEASKKPRITRKHGEVGTTVEIHRRLCGRCLREIAMA